jgi:genome maintenance exonuclease 1
MIVQPKLVKTFNHQFVETPQVTQINDPETGDRFYEVPGGQRYPSVTRILGELPNKGLQQWKARKGDKQAKAISDAAKDRGTLLHRVAEQYLLNNPTDFTNPIQKTLFRQLQPTLNSIDNIKLIEKALFSHRLRMAGTPDCVAEYGGVLSIIDFKTSTKMKDEKYITSYYCQCGAYSMMYQELFGIKPEQAVVIIAVEESNFPQVFKKDTNECFLMLKDYAKKLGDHREEKK